MPVHEAGDIAKGWLGVFAYCAFSFGFFYYSVTVIQHAAFILITGFFAAWGVAYIVIWVAKVLEHTRFGHARLTLLEPLPFPGGRLQALLALPLAVVQPRSVQAKLTCIRVLTQSNEQGKTYKQEEPVWQGKSSFPVKRSARGFSVVLNVRVGNPPELADRFGPDLGPEVIVHTPTFRWELEVSTNIPGTDLDRTFHVVMSAPQPGAAPAATPAAAPVAAAVTPAVASPMAPVAPVRREIPQASLAPQAEAESEAIPEETRSSASGIALIAANLLAIVGVVFWGWRVGDIVMLYWLENLVIGVLNVARIMRAQPEALSKLRGKGIEYLSEGALFFGKLALAGFFVVHYGGFCIGHGTFLVDFFPQEASRRLGLWATVLEVLREPGMLVAFAALIVSHAFSYFRNYIGTGEYLSADLGKLMFRPYGRIVVVHIFIIFGGFMLAAFKAQVLALVLFIALKIGIDFYMHRRERELFRAQ